MTSERWQREQKALPGVCQSTLVVLRGPTPVTSVAWEAESLAKLKTCNAEAKARHIPVSFALKHGVTLSLYLRDPEGNAVEIYWPTGRNIEGIYAELFDAALLEQPDAVLLGLVERSGSA